jgi:hypothetical protein
LWIDLKGVVNLVLEELGGEGRGGKMLERGDWWERWGGGRDFSFIDRRKRKKDARMGRSGGGEGGARKRIKRGDRNLIT